MIHKRTCGCVPIPLTTKNEQGADVAPESSSLDPYFSITLWSLSFLTFPEGHVGTNGCVLPENSGGPALGGSAGPQEAPGC